MSTQIDIKNIATQLGLSEQRVRTLCRTGELKAEKLGNTWLVDVDSVKHYGLQTAHMVAEDHPSYAAGKKNAPIALSFFSGAMGLDLGVERAGFDVKLACEIDTYCRQTITLNRPDMALIGDINAYCATDILMYAGLEQGAEIDLIMGGPPCQAFSTAGKRKGFNDERGNVFLKYLDVALEIRPKFIVFENVRGLLSCPMNHRPHNQRGPEYPDLALDELRGGALNFVLNRLRLAGYAYSFNLYNAANFGTPQVRERVIIIAARDGKIPPFLTPTHAENGAFNLPKWRTFRQAVKGITQHTHLNFPEKRLQYYRLLSAGQNWRNLPEELQPQALGKSFHAGGGKTGFLRRLAWDKPSPTLVTHPAMPATDLAHPQEDRPLSVEEYKRLQEFPEHWEFAGPLIEQYKQIGNAVPGSLGYALGSLIKRLLEDKAVPSYPSFEYSRYKNTSTNAWEREFANSIKHEQGSDAQYKLLFG